MNRHLTLFLILFLLADFSLPGQSLAWPWAGGMNACQFCELDINLDGVNDLLIFDRHGNRKLPFLRPSQPGTNNLSFRPDLARQLPDLQEWVLTADYNNDGRLDIFTYQSGGVRVYRNESQDTLRFVKVTDMITSFYYTGQVGILVTSVDYPAITDLDHDGDLDILTFFGLGSYVEFHKNLSMERYGNADSLDFQLESPCWGKFMESESGNRITLHAPCPSDLTETRHPEKERHTGSTMCAADLNGDALPDLILGDYDYSGLTALINGGTIDSAHMVSQDTAFPLSLPVSLYSFPAVSQIDADGDGKKDLLISSFDPSTETSENDHVAWYYHNAGTNEIPVYEFRSKDFIRDGMIDVGSSSHPAFADMDGDGTTDLLIGNEGVYDSSWYEDGFLKSSFISKISYYKNTGSEISPQFSFITDNLAGLSALGVRGLSPAPGDADGDGVADLITGGKDGTLIFLKGIPGTGDLPQFENPVFKWQDIDVGNYSAPQLFDLDRDQLPDLVIGEQHGNINYFRNSGSVTNPVFSFVTDSLGKISVTNPNLSWYGHSTPCFFRGSDDITRLVVGSDDGRLWFFDHIDGNLQEKFVFCDSLFRWISSDPADTLFGRRTSPALFHMPGDAHPSLYTGNFSGGLRFSGKSSPPDVIPGIRKPEPETSVRISISPNPASQRIHISWDDHSQKHLNIRIYNIFGEIMLESILFNHNDIDISHYPKGFYILKSNKIIEKLIIIR